MAGSHCSSCADSPHEHDVCVHARIGQARHGQAWLGVARPGHNSLICIIRHMYMAVSILPDLDSACAPISSPMWSSVQNPMWSMELPIQLHMQIHTELHMVLHVELHREFHVEHHMELQMELYIEIHMELHTAYGPPYGAPYRAP